MGFCRHWMGCPNCKQVTGVNKYRDMPDGNLRLETAYGQVTGAHECGALIKPIASADEVKNWRPRSVKLFGQIR